MGIALYEMQGFVVGLLARCFIIYLISVLCGRLLCFCFAWVVGVVEGCRSGVWYVGLGIALVYIVE